MIIIIVIYYHILINLIIIDKDFFLTFKFLLFFYFFLIKNKSFLVFVIFRIKVKLQMIKALYIYISKHLLTLCKIIETGFSQE